MASVTSISRPAREKGPIMPANTGRSNIMVAAFPMASMQIPVRPAPISGTARARAPSRSSTTRPVTVGTSSFRNPMGAPKASASTDRSIKLTEAAASVRSATSRIPSAIRSLSESSSKTLALSHWTEGNDSIGMGFLAGFEIMSWIHAVMLRFIQIPRKRSVAA